MPETTKESVLYLMVGIIKGTTMDPIQTCPILASIPEIVLSCSGDNIYLNVAV